MTPGQLLERLGFSSAHLSARVFELSGGQRRRLQFLLELLEEPNVLLLDEPTNDLDTDMLRAMEDLLDTWPGTLIVVSHDRYLLERITDQQYAVLNGFVRHVPGGIEEYLRLENSVEATGFPQHSKPLPLAADNAEKPRAGSKEHRELEKERRSIDKKIRELAAQIGDIDGALARADQADYERLSELTRAREEAQEELDTCEERWLELEELLN
jgi:ABC-type multidrug transport system ATPase subunit